MGKKIGEGDPEECPWCKRSQAARQPLKPYKRKKKRVVATADEWLQGELLRVKEEFLRRNPAFQDDTGRLEALLPGPDEPRRWRKRDQANLHGYAYKWDLARLGFPELKRAPYGSDGWIWNEGVGVIDLCTKQANLLVIGVDIRHDAAQIAEWVKDTILDVRLHRQNQGEDESRWKPLRCLDRTRMRTKDSDVRDALSSPPIHFTPDYDPAKDPLRRRITDFVKECHEALEAWDLYEQELQTTEIRDRLFPEAADVPPELADKIDFDETVDPESALRTTERRLSLARHMIFHEGYREILPLTGYRSQCEAVEQWRVSAGFAEEDPTP